MSSLGIYRILMIGFGTQLPRESENDVSNSTPPAWQRILLDHGDAASSAIWARAAERAPLTSRGIFGQRTVNEYRPDRDGLIAGTVAVRGHNLDRSQTADGCCATE